jgi:alpha-amylase
MIKNAWLLLIYMLLFVMNTNAQNKSGSVADDNEVIYHIFLRSFADNNGDTQGDLKGLQSKLDYLQDLGITSVLLTPLYSSPFYHNYFSDDFEKIDPEFGTMQDYLHLVKDIHKKGMRLYLDMETQYITEDHLWWKDSYNNPGSKYSDYILYNGKNNTRPESIIFNLTEMPGYDGTIRKVATVNLLNKNVFDYNYKLFKYFADPDNNGKFDDGADGFRLDHAMDDLDDKGKLTGLFEKFWKPLITKLKKINPKLKIVAEQAGGLSFGKDYFEKAGVDRVFAFQLQRAFVSFDKLKLQRIMDSTISQTPRGKQQVVFLENHDMRRFASAVNKDPAKERAGAALNLLIGGIPSIYYGQEIGMYGASAMGKYGMTDANDIPLREAFEWNKSDSGKDMAVWYKKTGPWWDDTSLHPNDGISLEEEKNDPGSLYRFYKTVLQLRKSNPALHSGNYQTASNNNDRVFSFLRSAKNQQVLVVLNLSGQEQQVSIDLEKANSLLSLLEKNKTLPAGQSINLRPYEVQVWRVIK